MRFWKSVFRYSAMAMLVLGIAVSANAQGTNAPPAAEAVPPPAAPAKRSAAELEKLVGPIALYPDALIATILPAAVYPLEIVQAARFMSDPANADKIDEQSWDDNVKAVARVPDALKKLNEDINWTIQLGEAFLAQDKDVMDTIQMLRLKAQKAGTLQTTEQQIVTVTNTVVETVVEQQAVIVTNTIVEIVPSDPEVIYVPQYVPSTVYYPPPAYVYDPYAPLLAFGAGVAVGVWIGNSCDWHGGGCYHGGDVDIDIDSNRNVNRNTNRNTDRASSRSGAGSRGQKWQPNQSRLNKSGGAGATSARSQQARGYGGGTGAAGARPSTGAVGARPSTGASGARPSTGAVGSRPSTGTAGTRPSTGTAGTRPSTGSAGSRPSTGTTPQVSRGTPSSSSTASRPSTSSRPSSSSSAFSGAGSGSSTRSYSNRGSSSRSSSGMSRGGGGGGSRGGGGGRGGGGRR